MRFSWKKAAIVFFAMLLLDVAFALYVIATAAKSVLMASTWAAVIQVANIFVVSSFVKDIRMAVPCIAGAFIGTAIAILYFT